MPNGNAGLICEAPIDVRLAIAATNGIDVRRTRVGPFRADARHEDVTTCPVVELAEATKGRAVCV
jgi:hypothetical protein